MTVRALQNGSKLTVMRFTEVFEPLPGWSVAGPFWDNLPPCADQPCVVPGSATYNSAKVLYMVDLNPAYGTSGSNPLQT